MRSGSDALKEVLTGPFTRQTHLNVYHGSERVAERLRVESWSLETNLSSEVKSSGSAVVVHESVAGESIVPHGMDGLLSPFRATIEPVVTITAGTFTERISLGLFQVVSVPATREYRATVLGESRVVASRTEIEFESLDVRIKRHGLRAPRSPQSTDSCWVELKRLTGLPVVKSLPDQKIPKGLVWEAKQGGRLEAVQKLAKRLGGTAVITTWGALTVIPDEAGKPVAELRIGNDGTITELGRSIDTDAVYNQVVGVFEQDDDRAPIYAVAQVTTGPLSVNGPYGVYTRYYDSDMVKTQKQANDAVNAVLRQSINSRTYDLDVTCHIDPLLEAGDVVTVQTERGRVKGQIRQIGLTDAATMKVVVRVTEELGRDEKPQPRLLPMGVTWADLPAGVAWTASPVGASWRDEVMA